MNLEAKHDDMLLPTDLDTTIQCDDMGAIVLSKYFLPIGATLSILCYLYLFWMYFVVKSPVLMRHPTALAVYKCIYEMIFIQQYLWLPFVPTRFFYSDLQSAPPYYCNASSLAMLLAFITQFSLIASEFCFLVISVDLRIAYTNPFSSFQQNQVYYAAFVVLSGLLSAVALTLCGPQVNGLASEGIVWIQTRRIPYGAEYYTEPNYPKFFFFYFPLILIYIYCLWANFQYYRSHTKGFSQTLSNRINIMQRSKRFTLSYLAYDTLTLLSEFMSFVNYYDSRVLNSLPSYCYCLRGIFSLLIILYSNHEDLSWNVLNPFAMLSNDEENDLVALEGLLMQPHLNAALRVELLYFTTKGIMHAARDYEASSSEGELLMLHAGDDTTTINVDNTNHQNSEVFNPLAVNPRTASRRSSHLSTAEEETLRAEQELIEESRCYSFDEHPHLGLRPSLMYNNGNENALPADDSNTTFAPNTFTTKPKPTQTVRPKSLQKQQQEQNNNHNHRQRHLMELEDEETGVAMRATNLLSNNTINNDTSSNSIGTTNGTEVEEDLSRPSELAAQAALAAEMNQWQAQQGKAVTKEIEDAFLEYRLSRISFAVAAGGDRDLLTPLTRSNNANTMSETQALLAKADTEKDEEDDSSSDEEDDEDENTEKKGNSLVARNTFHNKSTRRSSAKKNISNNSNNNVAQSSNYSTSNGKTTANAAANNRGSLWSRFSTPWLFSSSSQISNYNNHSNGGYNNSTIRRSSARESTLSQRQNQQAAVADVEFSIQQSPSTSNTPTFTSNNNNNSNRNYSPNQSINQSSDTNNIHQNNMRALYATSNGSYSANNSTSASNNVSNSMVDEEPSWQRVPSAASQSGFSFAQNNNTNANNNSIVATNYNSNHANSNNNLMNRTVSTNNADPDYPIKPASLLSTSPVPISRVAFTTNTNAYDGNLHNHNADNNSNSNSRSYSDDNQSLPGRSVSSARDKIVRVVQSALSNATLAAKSVLNPAYREFRFKDFAPRLFAEIRKIHNISAEDYASSFKSTCRERFTEGRSGAFMFYSANQLCIVKSTSQEDIFALRALLPAYVRYLTREPHTLLVRFIGAHCITMYGVDIYFTVMLNMFPPDQKAMSERYDLKGSWVNRHGNVRSKNGKSANNTQQYNKNVPHRSRLLKEDRVHGAPLLQDNDFLQRISLKPDTAKAVAEQIRHDVLFLRANGRMDYSLLIGVRRERFRVNGNVGHSDSDPDSNSTTSTSISNNSTTSSNTNILPYQNNTTNNNGNSGTGSSSIMISNAKKDPFDREPDGSYRAYMVEGPGVYYIGLIDLLQGWTLKKRLERLFKMYIRGKDGDGLSAMPPDDYAIRFYRRCVIDVLEHLDDKQMMDLSWHNSNNYHNNDNNANGDNDDKTNREKSVQKLQVRQQQLQEQYDQNIFSQINNDSKSNNGGSNNEKKKKKKAKRADKTETFILNNDSIDNADIESSHNGNANTASKYEGALLAAAHAGDMIPNNNDTNNNNYSNSNNTGDDNANSYSHSLREDVTDSMRLTAVVSPLDQHIMKQLQSDYV